MYGESRRRSMDAKEAFRSGSTGGRRPTKSPSVVPEEEKNCCDKDQAVISASIGSQALLKLFSLVVALSLIFDGFDPRFFFAIILMPGFIAARTIYLTNTQRHADVDQGGAAARAPAMRRDSAATHSSHISFLTAALSVINPDARTVGSGGYDPASTRSLPAHATPVPALSFRVATMPTGRTRFESKSMRDLRQVLPDLSLSQRSIDIKASRRDLDLTASGSQNCGQRWLPYVKGIGALCSVVIAQALPEAALMLPLFRETSLGLAWCAFGAQFSINTLKTLLAEGAACYQYYTGDRIQVTGWGVKHLARLIAFSTPYAQAGISALSFGKSLYRGFDWWSLCISAPVGAILFEANADLFRFFNVPGMVYRTLSLTLEEEVKLARGEAIDRKLEHYGLCGDGRWLEKVEYCVFGWTAGVLQFQPVNKSAAVGAYIGRFVELGLSLAEQWNSGDGTKGALLTGCVLIAVLQGGAAVKVKFRANDDQEQLMNFQSWEAYTAFMKQVCCGGAAPDVDVAAKLPPNTEWKVNPLQAANQASSSGEAKAVGSSL